MFLISSRWALELYATNKEARGLRVVVCCSEVVASEVDGLKR